MDRKMCHARCLPLCLDADSRHLRFFSSSRRMQQLRVQGLARVEGMQDETDGHGEVWMNLEWVCFFHVQ